MFPTPQNRLRSSKAIMAPIPFNRLRQKILPIVPFSFNVSTYFFPSASEKSSKPHLLAGLRPASLSRLSLLNCPLNLGLIKVIIIVQAVIYDVFIQLSQSSSLGTLLDLLLLDPQI